MDLYLLSLTRNFSLCILWFKVSGNNIIIGRGCTIDEVNYKDTVEVDLGSNVSKKTYTGKLNLLK